MRHTYHCYGLIVASALALGSIAEAQTIRRVDGDMQSESGDGISWSTAYKYLQDALAFAATNPGPEEIWVAATDPSNPYQPDDRASHSTDDDPSVVPAHRQRPDHGRVHWKRGRS
jgi:hypothetical protein